MALLNLSITLLLLCVIAQNALSKRECSDDSDCNNYAECKSKKCVCKHGELFLSIGIGKSSSSCQECTEDDHCPKYGECSRNKCRCKHGIEHWTAGILTKCDECVVDTHCPTNAECYRFSCKCEDGYEGDYKNEKLTRCKAIRECYSDYNCPDYARCRRDKCECKYGGSVTVNRKVISCSPNTVGIVCGVLGCFAFIAVIIGVFCVRRRRLARLSRQTAWVVTPGSVPTTVPEHQLNPATYPIQSHPPKYPGQYQPVPPAPLNPAYINNAYLPPQPPPYTPEPT